ncbi:MAG: VOC family protein [Actinomycetota bacterium]
MDLKLKNLFTVIATEAVAESCEFYAKYFGFEIAFEADWYVQLHGQRDDGGSPLELAFMRPDAEALPPSLQHACDGKGIFITIEVEDVDSVHERFRNDEYEMVYELRDEAWGQRHFIVRDPSGSLLDIVMRIPPSEEYRAAYLINEST